jgi:hypothetical protein
VTNAVLVAALAWHPASRILVGLRIRRACSDILSADDVEGLRVQHAEPVSGG